MAAQDSKPNTPPRALDAITAWLKGLSATALFELPAKSSFALEIGKHLDALESLIDRERDRCRETSAPMAREQLDVAGYVFSRVTSDGSSLRIVVDNTAPAVRPSTE